MIIAALLDLLDSILDDPLALVACALVLGGACGLLIRTLIPA